MEQKLTLRDYLGRYTRDTVPDLYFYAWRIFRDGYNPPNKVSILALAEKDAKEEIADQEHMRLQKKFNDGRVMSEDLHRGDTHKRNSLKWRDANG